MNFTLMDFALVASIAGAIFLLGYDWRGARRRKLRAEQRRRNEESGGG